MAIDDSRPNIGNRGYVSEEANEDGLYPVHGVAIGNNDITKGHLSGERKLWQPEVLSEAAETLSDKQFVVNHENEDSYKVIGEVTEAKYDESIGVLYRGFIDDEELASKIDRGWLEVSPRIIHSKEADEMNGVKIPKEIFKFDNLSIVPRGAAGSNEVELGEPDEFSVAELQDSFEDKEEEVADYERLLDKEETEELQEGVNFARWMFEDREGAEGASQRFPCEGTHKKEIEGNTYFMPCSSHENFLSAYKEVEDEMAESELQDLEDEMAYDEDGNKVEEYSQEMRKTASQLASFSGLTKEECLRLVSSLNPNKDTDMDIMSKVTSLSMDIEQSEMRRVMERLSGHRYAEMSEIAEDVSEMEGFEDVDSEDVVEALEELQESEKPVEKDSPLNNIPF